MSQNNQSQSLEFIAKYGKIFVLIVLAAVGLAGLVTMAMPRTYESKMKFLISNERADLVVTPEQSPTNTPPGEVTETEVNSELELLKSHDIVTSIVLDAQLYRPFQKDESHQPGQLAIERAAAELQKNLVIAPVRKSNVIEVSYRAGDPNLTLKVLRDLGESYLSAHLKVHSAPGTAVFFDQQVEKYATQITRIRAAINEFHRKKKIFAMSQQQASVVEQLQAVDSQLRNTQVESKEEEARLSGSRTQLATLPERLVTKVRDMPNQQAAQQLQTTLADLRNRRIDLATKFKPSDRLVVDLDKQIAATERELTAAKSESAVERTTDLDTLHESLKADYAKGQIAAQVLAARRAQLAALRQSYLTQLADMDESYAMLQNLEQYAQEAQDNYKLYVHRRDEARLAESLDAQKFSSVLIIERPVSSPIPVSPKLGMNLAVGAVIGCFLSLLVIFLLEAKGGNRTPSNAEEATGSHFSEHVFQASASGD